MTPRPVTPGNDPHAGSTGLRPLEVVSAQAHPREGELRRRCLTILRPRKASSAAAAATGCGTGRAETSGSVRGSRSPRPASRGGGGRLRLDLGRGTRSPGDAVSTVPDVAQPETGEKKPPKILSKGLLSGHGRAGRMWRRAGEATLDRGRGLSVHRGTPPWTPSAPGPFRVDGWTGLGGHRFADPNRRGEKHLSSAVKNSAPR